MKKLLNLLVVAAVAIVAMVGVAIASMTQLPNRSDGGLDWVYNPGGNTYKEGRQIIQGQLVDIATAGGMHFVIPQNGIMTEFHSIINNAVTTADCVLTFRYNDDATTQYTLTITQSGSAAGDVDSLTGQTRKVTKGAKLRLLSDGGCDTTTIAYIQVFIDPGNHQ